MKSSIAYRFFWQQNRHDGKSKLLFVTYWLIPGRRVWFFKAVEVEPGKPIQLPLFLVG